MISFFRAGEKRTMSGHLLAVAAIIFCATLWVFIVRVERKRNNTWVVVAEGVYDRVEYGYHVVNQSSGAMVHSTSYRRIEDTVIYFDDGRAYVARGRQDMSFPAGARIRICRNQNQEYRIEKAGGERGSA